MFGKEPSEGEERKKEKAVPGIVSEGIVLKAYGTAFGIR